MLFAAVVSCRLSPGQDVMFAGERELAVAQKASTDETDTKTPMHTMLDVKALAT